MYKFADLFCGGGGMSLGLVAAGFQDTIAVDFWEPAMKNYTTYDALSKSEFLQLDLFDVNNRAFLVEKLIEKEIDILAGEIGRAHVWTPVT